MRRQAALAFQAGVTIALMWLLFRSFNWPAFVSGVRRISPALYVGSLLAVSGGQVLYAARWRVVLDAMRLKVPFGEVLRQYAIGLFFSNLMPTAVGGDAAKVYYLGRTFGYVEVGASVVVDRVLGFFWLAVAGAALAWLIGTPSPLFALNRTLLTIGACGFLALLIFVRLVPFDLYVLRAGGGRWRSTIERMGRLAAFVRVGACRPSTLAASAAVMTAYMGMMTIVYGRFFHAVGATAPSALQVAAVLVSMAVFVNVPVSVNGIGLREQLHYLLFAALGVPKEAAVTISLLVFSHMLLLSSVGCAVWLRSGAAPALASPPSVA